MPPVIEAQRLLAVYDTARGDLLSQRVPEGHWVGHLSSSALSTATAASALAMVQRHQGSRASPPADNRLLIDGAIAWLAAHQNPDGGWGDTDKSISNISTTMLVQAAFHLAGAAAEHRELLQDAQRYVQQQGGLGGLRRRYGKDKTFAVPILTNCALAGLVDWRQVDPLPFELACLPRSWLGLLRLHVVSYAIPALVAIGQARYFHGRPFNPLTRLLRAAAVDKSLRVLARMQPASGGFLEATPLTSFVVMSLCGIGRCEHPVAQLGTRFLQRSVRPDGSWPIDTNLATWTTTLSINALAAGGNDVTYLECLDWLLSCQCRERHPYTGAAPGGWGWSDLSGSVPDADDTPGALLALSKWMDSTQCPVQQREKILPAATMGITWLLDLQNTDGGWPTFCRGWGKLPFDRSGTDLTAHAMRALRAWQTHLGVRLCRRIDKALAKAWRYLSAQQRDDGSWVPLWFGNQYEPHDENPVYGTARVLLAYRDLGQMNSRQATAGLDFLATRQNSQGSWGRGPEAAQGGQQNHPGIEETAIALEALLAWENDAKYQQATANGLRWLIETVEKRQHRESSPIGFYFAKLWYYEKLYPLAFTVSALGQAVSRLLPRSEAKPTVQSRSRAAATFQPTTSLREKT